MGEYVNRSVVLVKNCQLYCSLLVMSDFSSLCLAILVEQRISDIGETCECPWWVGGSPHMEKEHQPLAFHTRAAPALSHRSIAAIRWGRLNWSPWRRPEFAARRLGWTCQETAVKENSSRGPVLFGPALRVRSICKSMLYSRKIVIKRSVRLYALLHRTLSHFFKKPASSIFGWGATACRVLNHSDI